MIVIVSTKKSHPLVPALGVVMVTDVIGSADVELREMLPKALVEVSGAMPVNVFIDTNVAPEKASTT